MDRRVPGKAPFLGKRRYMRWLCPKGGFLVVGLAAGEKACVDFLRREIKSYTAKRAAVPLDAPAVCRAAA